MAKKNAAPTKSEILASISKETELSKKQVGAVFDSLPPDQEESAQPRLVHLPGLLKMKVVKKPATKAREGINPFNGEKMMFKAKPASKKVRIAALKNAQGIRELIYFASERLKAQPLRISSMTASRNSLQMAVKEMPHPGQ
jgi:DNA-binding protein HU-beta